MGLVFTIADGDKTLEIDTDTVTPLETRLIRRQTGLKWAHVLQGLAPADADGDAIAAIIWIAQRRVNPYTPFPENTPLGELLAMLDVQADEPGEDSVETGSGEADGPKEPAGTAAGAEKPGGKSSKSAPRKTSTT